MVGHAAEDKNDRWKRRDVLLFSLFPPLPSLSLIVSTNRKVENYYGSKSIRLPRVIGVSCPSRNSFLIYSRLFTSVKNYACSIDLQIVHRDIPIFEISKKVNVSFSLLFFFFESSTRITRKGDENVRSFRNYFVAY